MIELEKVHSKIQLFCCHFTWYKLSVNFFFFLIDSHKFHTLHEQQRILTNNSKLVRNVRCRKKRFLQSVRLISLIFVRPTALSQSSSAIISTYMHTRIDGRRRFPLSIRARLVSSCVRGIRIGMQVIITWERKPEDGVEYAKKKKKIYVENDRFVEGF